MNVNPKDCLILVLKDEINQRDKTIAREKEIIKNLTQHNKILVKQIEELRRQLKTNQQFMNSFPSSAPRFQYRCPEKLKKKKEEAPEQQPKVEQQQKTTEGQQQQQQQQQQVVKQLCETKHQKQRGKPAEKKQNNIIARRSILRTSKAKDNESNTQPRPTVTFKKVVHCTLIPARSGKTPFKSVGLLDGPSYNDPLKPPTKSSGKGCQWAYDEKPIPPECREKCMCHVPVVFTTTIVRE